MAEPDKRQIGDGSDNYGEAAKQMAKAAKEAGKETAKQAAVKGAEAGANAAAATVQAGVEGGKAVAEITAGTAAGGPWGAILSAAWAMRHTLFKILVCICLFFLVIIVLIVSLPSVVTNSVFGLDGSMVDMENPTTLLESYNDLAADISAVVEEGYDAALAKVEQIIEDGGYDYDLSMDALINYAQGSAGYDVSYILAAYSASLQQRNTGKEDMLAKLRSVADSMFPVSFVEKESEQIVPFTYATYRPVTVTVVTSKTQTGTINGVPQYRYTTARRTYYEPDETITTSEPVNVAAYTPVAVSVPIYSGGRITGTRSEIYYEHGGTETLAPETEVVKYVECTIQPFDNSVIIRAFGIDPSATYDQFKITYGEAIQKMANALKMTLYGTLGNGQMVPLTDAELIAFVNAQNCSPMRKHIITTALSLVGKVPYFWGGKSAPGWNDAWNTPRLVTSAGSPTTGTIRPYGLDCSGFTTWVFNTAVGVEIGAGCNGQYPNTYGVSAAELLPGDLGFLADDDGWGHVLIFAGYDAEGTRMWVHSSGGIGVILNTPSYEGRLSYRRLSIVDYGEDFQFYDSCDMSTSAQQIETLYLQETARYGVDNVALLTPYRQKTETGVNALNERLREKLNPQDGKKPEVVYRKRIYRLGDKVMQIKNCEDISNGDIGYITSVTRDDTDSVLTVDFGDGRIAEYDGSDLEMLDLAYASTIHKSQGSEYKSVIINLQCAHAVMLVRPLVYTAITRAKERVLIVGERRALCIAIKRTDTEQRGTMLSARIKELISNVKGDHDNGNLAQ